MPHTRNENLFEDYSYTKCATSKTEHEPQRRREKRASKLDVLYENAWHSVAKPPRSRSDITRVRYLFMRAPSVVPRNAVAVGSLEFMQRGNGDTGATR